MRVGNLVTMAAFLVIGGVLGWILSSTYSNSQSLTSPAAGVGGGPVSQNASPNSKSADFRVQTQALFREHTSLAGQYIQKMIKNEDPSAIKSGLDKNTQRLSGVVSSVYGGNWGTDFNMLWNDHIKAYAEYAIAAKNNDANEKIKIRNHLIGMSEDFEKFMDDINETSVDRIGDLMQEHAEGTLKLADAAAAKNDELVVDLAGEGEEQAGRFADYFTQVIISEKPELFR